MTNSSASVPAKLSLSSSAQHRLRQGTFQCDHIHVATGYWLLVVVHKLTLQGDKKFRFHEGIY